MFKALHQDLIEIISILRRDRLSKDGAFFLFLILSTSSIVISYSLAFFLLSTYILGLIVCYVLIKFRKFTSSSLFRLLCFYKGQVLKSSRNGSSCAVCRNPSCGRHRQDFDLAPWNDLLIDETLNESIEKFYTKMLDVFVSSWYNNLTKDVSFIHELKYALKYSTAVLIRRIMDIDLPILISRKMLPCLIKHVDDIIYIENIAKLKNSHINDVAVEYWGNKLHGAVTNRSNELIYLRELASSLLPIVLPPKYSQCRNSSVLFQELFAGWVLLPVMDATLNPDMINSLIIVSASFKSEHLKSKALTSKVCYLRNFEGPIHQEKSLFYRDLNEVKENTELLYTFIQFLKDEDQVHLLKFCLDVDQFSNILMAPDHSKKMLDELYGNALAIYNEYFSQESANFIKCSENISQEMKELLKDGVRSIAKLKISAPLMEAYKVVFNNLEENWLPLFYKSNEFYSYLCGLKTISHYNKTLSNETNKQEVASLTPGLNSLRKLRSALMNSTPVEGGRLLPEKQSFEGLGEIVTPICYNIFRDISTWRISISSYVSLNKVIYFHVNVKRPTTNNETETSRVVLRKDQDFFTLKAKLIEFHGEKEITDSPLPARKAGSDIGTRMAGYEKFLQNILKNTTLRGSDLLYTFLTTEDDFSLYLSTCGAPVQDLSNIYQSVAQKLRKEKGQHLDNFMNVFMASTGNDTTGKFSTLEIGDEVDPLGVTSQDIPTKTFHNAAFNNDFGVSFNDSRRNTTNSVNPVNILECLFYIGKHILNTPVLVLRFYVATCNMIGETLESIWCLFIQKKLTWLCQQHLAYLVTSLQEIIFDDPNTSLTTKEFEKRKEEALNIIKMISNEFPYNLFGKNFSDGVLSLWKSMQNPLFNKQLTYQLLDILLLEMYPMIVQTKK